MSIENLKKWAEAGAPRTNYISFELRITRAAAKGELEALLPHEEWYWRGTNRADEIEDIASGVQIMSRNHATGELEQGMSVSKTLATVWAYGYKYAYKVTGDEIGTGSDGEPVIVNAKPVSPLMDAAEAIARDGFRKARRQIVLSVAEKIGVKPSDLFWLLAQ
ncbi:MAG: hypothetical protein D6706_20150 [Chloroflexi bacterium]|nr:MAG: hypothetical protein D6706_20150 [Chloroflexota bacterium]